MSAAMILAGAGSAGAVTRNMTGAAGIFNPSVAAPFLFEGGVDVWGKKQGVYPPTDGAKQIDVAGTAPGTQVGRQVNFPANVAVMAGGKARAFPAFPTVAQTTKTYMTNNLAATFMVGGGALAACPGPGCNLNGLGNEIEYCPPLAHNPADPAPGIVSAKVGNWDCQIYNNPGAGNRAKRWVITNQRSTNEYGGTLRMLHSQNQNVWRVRIQPSTAMASDAVVERSWMQVVNDDWDPGRSPNFVFGNQVNNNGARIRARLDAEGAVKTTFNCANGNPVAPSRKYNGRPPAIGPFNPIIGNEGGNCGTATAPLAGGQGWGFKMTTGTLSGSDIFPFSTETTAMLGTPFNPNRIPLVFGQGFYFTRMGDDSVSGTGPNQVRNLVLLGGSIAVDPGSGNAYDRLSTVRMRIVVPEPAGAAGLIAGLGALVGLALRGRSRVS
ncbi:hypothetical protein K2X89_16765 [Myxococcota bacterium]|nr:hypothetical protein [Myxococcota bacterium]